MKFEIADRMKTYENIAKTQLEKKVPVAIRIDGKAFHTFTRGFEKPFDEVLINSMQETMKYLCANIQGCVFGYAQSDEITLILIDYQNINTSAWFDYEVQKICSISASMATLAFSKAFSREVSEFDKINKLHTMAYFNNPKNLKTQMHDNYWNAYGKGAMFDARCFNIPKEEVTNLIYWRQLDAIRNSIQMVGQAYFSHKELQGKSCNDIKDMLISQKNINWENFSTHQKRGSCCIKTEKGWIVDKEIPVFKGKDREYIDRFVIIEE